MIRSKAKQGTKFAEIWARGSMEDVKAAAEQLKSPEKAALAREVLETVAQLSSLLHGVFGARDALHDKIRLAGKLRKAVRAKSRKDKDVLALVKISREVEMAFRKMNGVTVRTAMRTMGSLGAQLLFEKALKRREGAARQREGAGAARESVAKKHDADYEELCKRAAKEIEAGRLDPSRVRNWIFHEWKQLEKDRDEAKGKDSQEISDDAMYKRIRASERRRKMKKQAS